ncbi:MAG: U32 family peptidase [Lachnospiraceae bacterium]|nr:U32 family peptidase [Lachnospiraceae bacterium]
MKHRKRLELLSPAGDISILRAVIQAGADAVYIGGPAFGARAYANNFSIEELLEALDYAHFYDKKIYLTLNTLLKENEIEEQLYDYLLPFYEQGLDAVIVQDFGVLTYVKQFFPELAIHASTQMTVTGADGAAFLKNLGVSRIVTARELSFAEIRQIREETTVEIESFVHGALCYCYSGQCLMSSMLGGRSGNRGRCAQPCRLPYQVLDTNGKILNRDANYVLSPKDLSTISMIPELAKCGINSFKIEGRMKQVEYAAGVTSIYRKYVDLCERHGSEAFSVEKSDEKLLFDLGNRNGFTRGYYEKHNGADLITFCQSNHTKSSEVCLIQEEVKEKSKRKIKGILKLFLQKNATLTVKIDDIEVTVEGEIVDAAQKKPLDQKNVAEKIKKTGDTLFVFEELKIEMDENVFVPIGQLNALRRQALWNLQEELLRSYRRKAWHTKSDMKREHLENRNRLQREVVSDSETFLSVSLERPELLDLVCSEKAVGRIYLEADAFLQENDIRSLREICKEVKANQKQAYLALPFIFREHTKKRYQEIYEDLLTIDLDGFLVKNYEELGFLKRNGYTGKIVSDHNLYTYSNRARQAFLESGIEFDTIPLELNLRELHHRGCFRSELFIYGYLPLMVTAGCLHKSLGRCEKREELYGLKDRYDKVFPVKNNCRECYNIIYNSSPLALFGMAEEIKKLHPLSYRIHLSKETRSEAEQVFEFFRETWLQAKKWDKNSMKDYTNGHMKRGVE